MIGTRVRLNRRDDDEMGELALDHIQVRELLSICERETERRRLCLEVAKEYAKQEDFESARRYLQANYLGSSPSYLKEEQKYLADIHSRRRQEAEETMRSQDTGSQSLNQTEEGRFSSQAPEPVRYRNEVTIECNRNEDSRARSNEVEPMDVDTNSGGDSDSEIEDEPSRNIQTSSTPRRRESHDTRGSQVEPGRSQAFAYASPEEVENGRERIRGRNSRGQTNPPTSRVSLHKEVTFKDETGEANGSRKAELESSGVIASEPKSGTVDRVAQTENWTEEKDSDSKPEFDKSKIDYDFDSEPEPECCGSCSGFCYKCIICCF